MHRSIVTIMMILSIGFLFTKSAFATKLAATSAEGMQRNLVCMVNDKFMGEEQIPVPFEGKTYYGCCKGCVLNLQNNRSLRYAADPYTGAEVDKAEAFIASKPGGRGEVLYFQSQENHEAYLELLQSESMSLAIQAQES